MATVSAGADAGAAAPAAPYDPYAPKPKEANIFEVAKEVETEMPPPAFPTISTKLIVDAAAEAMLPFNWIPKDVRVKMAHFPSKQDIEMGRHSKLLPEASLLKTITRYHLERQKSFVMNSTQKKVRRASCC